MDHSFLQFGNSAPLIRENRHAWQLQELPDRALDASQENRRVEKVKDQFRNARSDASNIEPIVQPHAEEIRAEAKRFVGRNFDAMQVDLRFKKYLSDEQIQLLKDTNSAANDAEKIRLGLDGNKLYISQGGLDCAESLLSQLYEMKNEFFRANPGAEYRIEGRDINALAKALEEYMKGAGGGKRETFPEAFSRGAIESLRSKQTISNAYFNALKEKYQSFVRRYPAEYLRILTEAIRKNPLLIRRLENGGEDSDFVSDKDFEGILTRFLVTEESLPIIRSLSDEWKKNHLHTYRTLVRDAAKVNPSVLAFASTEYELHWQDDYTDAQDQPKVTYEDVIKNTFNAPEGKTEAERKSTARAIYSVSRDWLEKSEENRDAFHRGFVLQAAKPNAGILSGLNENTKHLLNDYKVDNKPQGELGWAYVVLDIVKKNPDAIKELSQSLLWSMKNDVPQQMYNNLKNTLGDKPELLILLQDEDITRNLLENPADFEEALRKNPDLLHKIDVRVLTDPRNKNATESLIVKMPVLLRSIPTWQKDKNIAGNLVQRNAGVYAFLDESLKRDPEIITAAISAEESGHGNFHWQSAPPDTYQAIATKLGGGDPNTTRLVNQLFDPNFKNEKELFNLFKSIPNTQRQNPIIVRAFLEKNKGNEAMILNTVEFDNSILAQCAPEATGLTWDQIMKAAVNKGLTSQTETRRQLPADAVLALAKQLSEKKEERAGIWGEISDEALTGVLIRIRNAPALRAGIAEIRGKTNDDARLEALLNNEKSRASLLQYPSLVGALIEAQPTLIPRIFHSLIQSQPSLIQRLPDVSDAPSLWGNTDAVHNLLQLRIPVDQWEKYLQAVLNKATPAVHAKLARRYPPPP